MKKIIKIEKLEHCQKCQYMGYDIGRITKPFLDALGGKGINRYKCHNPDNARKNGSCRILNRKAVGKGLIPGWCNLEDYKDA